MGTWTKVLPTLFEQLLIPSIDFEVHQLLYYSLFFTANYSKLRGWTKLYPQLSAITISQ